MAQSKATQTLSPPGLSIATQTVSLSSIATQTVSPSSIAIQTDSPSSIAIQTVSSPSIAIQTVSSSSIATQLGLQKRSEVIQIISPLSTATRSDLKKMPAANQTVSPSSIATPTVSQKRIAAVQSVPQIFQYKVSWRYARRSPVWRRFQMLADSHFRDLHYAIQCVMGWSNTHLYQFQIFKKRLPTRRRYGDSDDEDFDPDERAEAALRESDHRIPRYIAAKMHLKEWFPMAPEYNKMLYTYDGWQHLVVLEKTLPAVGGETYPKCITGRKETPKEDPTESEYDSDYIEDPDFKFDPKSVKFDHYHKRNSFGLSPKDSEFEFRL